MTTDVWFKRGEAGTWEPWLQGHVGVFCSTECPLTSHRAHSSHAQEPLCCSIGVYESALFKWVYFLFKKIYLNKYIQKFMCWYSNNLKDCAHLQGACESCNLLLGLTTDEHWLPRPPQHLGRRQEAHKLGIYNKAIFYIF